MLEVAAAAVFDSQGRVLIARRPENVHQGGLWEFPGGKVEPGEAVEQALARELWEELGIRPTRYRRLIRIPHHYSDRSVLLDVWRVEAFEGTPHGRQGQPLRWVAPASLPNYPFPAANRPIVAATRLPLHYLITPDCAYPEEFLQRLEAALDRGIRLVQLRTPSLSSAAFEALAGEVIAACRVRGAQVLLNAEPELALRLGADGVHLSSPRLQALRARPVPADLWCAASCHDAAELLQASAIGVDFAVLSPVQATASHPQAAPLGWRNFERLVWDLPLPVYALGGVGPDDLADALAVRAQGVAAIRALW
ncbi:MAG TPA: Nudix family hydrolase [Gammaproteobacteria bacterium]|nr:Nudix family hydrolase [Gammaproteobacteria bacterium]